MKCKKIVSGCYEFGGFKIEKVGDCWHITKTSEDFPCDAACSLQEAKQMVSHWIKFETILEQVSSNFDELSQ